MTARTEEFWTLANYLTLFRIAAIPLVAVLLLFYPGKWPSFAAALIFLLGAVSDVLDGYLARRRNTVSNMGKLLDPLADKLLVGVSLILLIPLGYVSAWIVAVILGRELAVTTLRGVAGGDHRGQFPGEDEDHRPTGRHEPPYPALSLFLHTHP
jgi:CDP-diacylglycerol--glycerol-3-phosphate 3-phosphatidyltransferase